MNWLISANSSIYRHENSFEDYNFIDWRQGNIRYNIGDIVYIYCTIPEKKIRYKCIVEKIDLPVSEIRDDREYWNNQEEYKKSIQGKYIKLRLLEKIDSNYLNLDNLLQNGLNAAPQKPQKITNNNLLEYIEKQFSNSNKISPEMIDENYATLQVLKKQITTKKYEKNFMTILELLENYKGWKVSKDYNEGYKWDFIEKFSYVFDNLNNSKVFSERYINLISEDVNFRPYDLIHYNKMFSEICNKYPEENMKLFRNLLDESVNIENRIIDFVSDINKLREKVNWEKEIHVPVATFFLFTKYPKKYPLASAVGFIKEYFKYFGIDYSKKTGLALYLFYYNYVHETLLPLMKEKFNVNCSAIDAQDFVWFVSYWQNSEEKKLYKNSPVFQPKKIYTSVNNESESFEDFCLQEKQEEENIQNMSDEEIFKKASAASTIPEEKTCTTKFRKRNQYIATNAKRRADGFCQLCEDKAPFLDKSNNPYLESHHIIWLSNGGEDTVSNTVALCPNCHKKMHILNKQEDINKLKSKIEINKI